LLVTRLLNGLDEVKDTMHYRHGHKGSWGGGG
jgi:hypothetical protein